ncbi:MAG: hypothetical protein HYS24_15050 [Ignavibacteriales bacterium]|nr:hypothetical protein [Ignavibacteriales bacterium]
MALYFLSYNLRKDRNYQRLYNILNDMNAVPLLESTWCFRRIHTKPNKLRDFFKDFLDADDGFIVTEVVDWSSSKITKTPNDLVKVM